MATPAALRTTEAMAMAYRRTWRGSVFSSFLSPVLFLAAIGLGLGSLVDEGTTAGLEGGDYLAFLAPGLLAATAMQTGSSEALWPVMAGIKWVGSYQAMLATPIGVRDLALGHLAWMGVRVAITSAIFLAVTVLFGAVESPWAVLAFPAAVLTGMAHAAPIAAYTATVKSEYALSGILRFLITPLFLFSGTFFPIDQLPPVLRAVAPLTPLWNGVELCRSFSLGTATPLAVAGHTLYLGVWIAAGAALAVRQFRRKLVT